MNAAGLRMKLVIFLLLLGLNSVSASLEMNDTKGVPPAAELPESVNVAEMKLREAAAAHEHDRDRAELLHCVMFAVIVAASVLFIVAVLVKALRAPKDKGNKLLAAESLDVEKTLWIVQEKHGALV